MKIPSTDWLGVEGGCRPATLAQRPGNVPWWQELLWGAPSFFTTRTELFVLCMVRAAIYPWLIAYVYVRMAMDLFVHSPLPTSSELVGLAILFPLFEEHSRFVFARTSRFPIAAAVLYSLAFCLVETILFAPMWSGDGSPIDPWSYFALVRGICIAAHGTFGLIVGIGLRLGTTGSCAGGIAIATLCHALFNWHGVSVLVAQWLIDG